MKRLLSILVIILVSCSNGNQTKDSIGDYSASHPGKALMETNCYVCHSPKGSHDNRLAPPLEAVKMHYMSEDISKEQFIADIESWVKDPKADNARMFGAVRRFGVMAKTPFPEQSVKLIADYMYSNDLDKPEWFDDHIKEMGNCKE